MTDRRTFLSAAGLAALARGLDGAEPAAPGGAVVNDVQSRLNPTRVASIERPDSPDALRFVCFKPRGGGRD